MSLPDKSELFFQVTKEIKNGELDKVLWSQVLLQAGGDVVLTRTNYRRLRVEQLLLAQQPGITAQEQPKPPVNSSNTVRCSQCNTENVAGANFCESCGNQLNQQVIIEKPSSNPTNISTPFVYAGFRPRLSAAFIDGILSTLIYWAIVALFFLYLWVEYLFTGVNRADNFGDDRLAGLHTFFSIAVVLIYFTVMESGKDSATFGKKWLGLKVLSSDGARISTSRAFFRYISRFLSMLLLFIGYLMQPFTKKKQALHDIMTDTIVIKDGAGNSSAGNLLATILIGLPIIGILAAIGIPSYQGYVKKEKDAEINISLQAEVSHLNVDLPKMLDDETRHDSVQVLNKEIRYNYTLINYPASDFDKNEFFKTYKPRLLNTVCTAEIQPYLQKGVVFSHAYFGNDEELVSLISITPSDCKSKLLNAVL
ncbi:MAG: RDD family protein [Methylotenera sp.]|nr:RDD family protein [Methylotenera sp.]